MKKLQKLDINLFKSFEIKSAESFLGGDDQTTSSYCTSATGANNSDTYHRYESDFIRDGFTYRTNVFDFTTNDPYQ